ncbi:hypothetical protein FOHLNKBM_5090 [Methylobacterium longum]|nr:hypothetical protein FOHLNKBM_5090 [Methylobacterium longum]
MVSSRSNIGAALRQRLRLNYHRFQMRHHQLSYWKRKIALKRLAFMFGRWLILNVAPISYRD